MDIVIRMLAGMLASLFFGYIFRTPHRAVWICALLGGLGFFICTGLGDTAFAYYIATLVISLCGEFCARRMKMPTTVFVSVAVIPIVPGAGLYNTVLFLAQADYPTAMARFAGTMTDIGAMALGIATSSMLVRLFAEYRRFVRKGNS